MITKRVRRLTSLTRAVPEASSSTVTDEAVPSLLTHPVVLAGIAVALFPCHLAARRLDPGHVLGLSYLPDVLAASIDKQIPHAAHVAIVKHSCPELGGKHQAHPVVRQTTQIKVPLKVQDLIFSTGCERGPPAVYRDDAWRKEKTLLMSCKTLYCKTICMYMSGCHDQL